MATAFKTRPWNWRSAVICCETCEGHGRVASSRRPTTGDPYPEAICPDCDGPHYPECAVCGCTTVVEGYDCIACYVAEALPMSADLENLAGAIHAALIARGAA